MKLAHVFQQLRLDHPAARAVLTSGIPLLAAGVALLALLPLPGSAAWIVQQGGVLLALTLGLALICGVPGLALLAWLWPDAELTWPERLFLAGGIGAALAPLLIGFASIVRLPLGSMAICGYLLVAAALLLIRRRSQLPATVPLPAAHTGLLVLVLALVLLARLYAVRDQLVGANVDSFHHTMITQLLVDHGRLFQSWQPYAELATFTYHFGFHALAAMLHWLTGVSVAMCVLYTGQIMSAATAAAVYLLAARLSGMPAAGLWAALLAGLVNLQPAYYAFWGRYTYLVSHVILVAVLLIWLALLARPAASWRLMLLAALTTAGLALTHYQTTILAVLFLGASLFVVALRRPQWRQSAWLIGRAALTSSAALILVLPWLLVALGGHLGRNSAAVVESAAASETAVAAGAVVVLPAVAPFYLKLPIIALALGGLLLAFRRKEYAAGSPALWTILVVVAAAPLLIGLPGTGLIEPVVAFAALYLTATPLAGYLLGTAHGWARQHHARLADSAALLGILLVGIWSIGWQQGIVPAYARLVTPADAAAYAWVRDNTPADARFVVNSSPIYQGSMVVGVDGGWWLPLLAQRSTTVPPMTIGSEVCLREGCDRTTLDLARTLRNRLLRDPRPAVVDLTREEALMALRVAGVRYVYSGAQLLSGPGTFPQPDRFDLEKLRTSPAFRSVYAADGVEIFEVVD
ncbi:MAG TPA: hypothetical protein PKA05_04025 [Roseiflexaceae bacterium]|nr:hypothetical protein [Roseiflexaceae bacterium]